MKPYRLRFVGNAVYDAPGVVKATRYVSEQPGRIRWAFYRAELYDGTIVIASPDDSRLESLSRMGNALESLDVLRARARLATETWAASMRIGSDDDASISIADRGSDPSPDA